MMQTGQRMGMQTFDMAVQDLLKRGVVDKDSVPPPAHGTAPAGAPAAAPSATPPPTSNIR